jgi:(2Fe-2S) ferredoxin
VRDVRYEFVGDGIGYRHEASYYKELTMNKPEHHIFVCASFRVGGEPKGICYKKGSVNLLQYLETEINDRGLENIVVSSSGCLKFCDKGPVMVVYPEADWYGEVTESAIDEILDALEAGTKAEKYLIK